MGVKRWWRWLVNDADDAAKEIEQAGQNVDLLLEKGQAAIVKLIGKLLAIGTSLWVGLGAAWPHLQKLPDHFQQTGVETIDESGPERTYRVRGRRELENE